MQTLMIPIIRVKDNQTGLEHIVGKDSHDELVINGNALHYTNLQSMTGTRYEGYYKFIGVEPDEERYETTVEFVTIEEFAKLYESIVDEQLDAEIKLQDHLKKLVEKIDKKIELENSEGFIKHT